MHSPKRAAHKTFTCESAREEETSVWMGDREKKTFVTRDWNETNKMR